MSASNPNPEDHRNFVFTVTTPTLPLTSAQYLLKLIQSHSHYQVIPAPLMLNYDADEMVMTALPLSKNKLIDLTLPLIIADSTGNEVNYLGRYLIYDQRLVGIRLCSSRKEESYGNGEFKKWRFGRISRHRVAKCISDYYKKQKFAEDSYNNQIPIGDFTLTIGDIKVCLLFQSEIQDNQTTLIEYKRQGCEIFSIVCDIPRDQVFQATMNITNAKLSTKNENMFRRFIRQNNRLMIYAGARIATKDSLFLANSFIIHPELPEKCIEPFFFNDGVTLSVLCNVQLFKRPGARREKFSDSKVKPELHILTNLISINSRPGKSTKFYANGQIEQTLFSKTNGDLLKKMKLWCIYQIDNQRTPFILPIPLSQKMEEIISQLEKLSQYLGKPLSSILILYKKNKEAIVNEELEQSLKVELYEDFDDLCKKCSHQHLNIYTDDHSHYLHLTSRVESYKRVRLHYDYLKFSDDSVDRKAQVEKISKMNDFASHVIKKRIIGYQRLLIESRSQEWRLTKDEQVQAIAIYLKSKLRSQVNNHPFYKNILFRSTEEIRAAMIEAQSKLANSQTSMADESIFQNPPAEEEASVNNENNLDIQLKEMRKSQSKQQKRQNVKCHRCCCLFEKSLLHRCSICRTDICLVCIQEKQTVSVKTKQALIESAKCLVCRKLCNCLECLNKEKLDQSRNLMDISTTNISQANDKQTQKQAIEYRDYCTVCLINQRKNSKIKVSCSTCDREECLACIRSQRRNTTITLEWQCSICKPYVQPPAQPMISEDDKAMEVEEPARKPSKSKSNSRSASPPKKTFVRRQPYNNNNNNRQNNFNNNNNNSNFKSNWNQNKPNNNFNKGNNNSNANEDRKSRSVSRSASPVKRPVNRANNNNNQQKRSASRSNSPKKNVQNNKKKSPQRSPSRSYSKSPPRNKNQPAKIAEKKKSPSRSNSPLTPPRNTQKQKPKSPPKSPSRSKSPVKANNTKANERKRSNSRPVSPPRNKPAEKKKSRSRSVSKSKSPPRKTPAAQERKKSVSRSGSPPKQRKNARKSVSKSRSKSRERSRDDNKNRNYNNNSRNNNQPQPERLWNNDRPRENKWNNNNNSGDGNNNRDRNQNYQNNRGGYQGNRGRGGFQNNYNRNNDRNNDRNNNQGDDGNNRRYNNNSSYNNRDNNNSYNNRDNSRNNNSGENNNNQLLEVSNFEVNNDVDY